MQPITNGRHCAHCQETVVDFTRMTDAALLEYVQRNGLGCGRFRDEQLERVVSQPKRSKQNWWIQVALSMGLLLKLNESGAQVRANVSTVISPEPSYPQEKTIADKDTFSISGIVRDDQDILIYAVVSIVDASGTKYGSAITDFDGYFWIGYLDASLKASGLKIEASYLTGTTIQDVDFSRPMQAICISYPVRHYTTGIIVTVVKKQNFYQRTYRKIRRTFRSGRY